MYSYQLISGGLHVDELNATHLQTSGNPNWIDLGLYIHSDRLKQCQTIDVYERFGHTTLLVGLTFNSRSDYLLLLLLLSGPSIVFVTLF